MTHVQRPEIELMRDPMTPPEDDGWADVTPQDPTSPPESGRQDKPDGFVPRLDAAGIFAPLEPVEYVIRAIDLCPGAPGMWAGYGYSGKTVAAQSAALALASGLGKIWDAFSAAQGRVLHLDYEQGSRLTRERYQRLAVPMMVGPSDLGDRLSLVTMPTRYLDHPAAETELARLVDGYQLVIVDSLRACAPSIDENSSDVRRVLDAMSRVSEQTGAAFVIIHHARKPTKDAAGGAKMAIRGSGALFDACSSVLVFEAEKGQPTRVSHEKARASGVLTDDFELRIEDYEDGGNPRAGLVVSASGAPDRAQQAEDAARDARRARTEAVMEEMRSLFKERTELGGADSIATLLGRPRADVRGALALLVDLGEVESIGSTRDRRHRWRGDPSA